MNPFNQREQSDVKISELNIIEDRISKLYYRIAKDSTMPKDVIEAFRLISVDLYKTLND